MTKIMVFRILYLLCMIVSSAVIPDHNPGDDVLRFDLRLHSSSSCFCDVGQSCAASFRRGTECAISSDPSPSFLPASIWVRLLSPFTKWDAARFLQLALRPQSRYPTLECARGDVAHCDFADSEQAHAFFPFFPFLVNSAAICWMFLVPSFLLPPTYECLLVMAGVFINFLCTLVGSMALYSLTVSVLPTSLQSSERHRVATAACLVYGIWNPAIVFFATNYSESLFGALALSGHVAFIQNMYWLALPTWMLASWTRANGTIHSLWLVFQLLGCVCHFIQGGRKPARSTPMSVAAGLCLVGAALIFLPLRYHDLNGYTAHCTLETQTRPSWCQHESASFSLYAWTQREHWNVGPFRYYEAKQIPNFLLAAPILILSVVGVVRWIGMSMTHFGRGKLPRAPYLLLVGWPLEALSDFVERTNPNMREEETPEMAYSYLINNPGLLGHYAILAGLTLLCLIVAHVQISTRMIMSSTPAIVWFLTYCHLQTQSARLRQVVSVYTQVFMFLGLVMHVNFLPWT